MKPNGKNIEIALELLELSLILKKSVKKAIKKKIVPQHKSALLLPPVPEDQVPRKQDQ